MPFVGFTGSYDRTRQAERARTTNILNVARTGAVRPVFPTWLTQIMASFRPLAGSPNAFRPIGATPPTAPRAATARPLAAVAPAGQPVNIPRRAPVSQGGNLLGPSSFVPKTAARGIIPVGYEDPDIRAAERYRMYSYLARTSPTLAPLLTQTEAVATSRSLFGYQSPDTGLRQPGAFDEQGNLVWPGLRPAALSPTIAAAMGLSEDQRAALGYNPEYPYNLLQATAGLGGGGGLGGASGVGGTINIGGGGGGRGPRGQPVPLTMWRV